ncbi:MAG: PAS domain-containing protein [Bauldia sp.]
MNQVSAYLRHFLDAFLEPTENEDDAAIAARRLFVGGHLALTVCGLAALPLLIAFGGPLNLAEALTFAWLAAPLGAALLAARTGNLTLARFHYCGLLTGFIVWVATVTGSASGAAMWLALVPIEASLANSRRLTVFAAGLALLAWAALSIIAAIPFVPRAASAGPLADVLPVLGLLYAAALGIRLNAARRLEAARNGGELVRYRRLAEGSPDLITEHGPDGSVLFASLAAETVLEARPAALAGVGLLERIHIGDRPAWLTALSRALARGEEGAADIRIRIGERGKDGSERLARFQMLCRRVFDVARDGFAVVAVLRRAADDPTFATTDSSYDGAVVRIGELSAAVPLRRSEGVGQQQWMGSSGQSEAPSRGADAAVASGGLGPQFGDPGSRSPIREKRRA